jgi:hypothetical protein
VLEQIVLDDPENKFCMSTIRNYSS